MVATGRGADTCSLPKQGGSMRRPLILAAVIATAAALAGPVSTASADSWLHKWSYLHFPSISRDSDSIERTIHFSRGLYRWRLFMAHWSDPKHPVVKVRRIRLGGGDYLWQETLNPSTGYNYRHGSGLW